MITHDSYVYSLDPRVVLHNMHICIMDVQLQGISATRENGGFYTNTRYGISAIFVRKILTHLVLEPFFPSNESILQVAFDSAANTTNISTITN